MHNLDYTKELESDDIIQMHNVGDMARSVYGNALPFNKPTPSCPQPLPREECRAQKKKAETCETGALSVNINNNNKGKKSRRKASEGISG